MAPFLFLLFLLSEAASDLPMVPVRPGHDVILPCQAAYPFIRAVEWSRADLKPDIVFVYSDGLLNTTHHHPSFKDRVELVDRDLKDGDVSLILKNVNIIDAGTYECRVKTNGSVDTMVDIDSDPFTIISIIRLQFPARIVVTVNPGQDAILPCQAAGSSIIIVDWSRPDLEPDIVLLYSDGYLSADDQNPSFKGRVDLVDRDLKDGNVSLILKNVRSIDTGTYECRVKTGGSRHKNRAIVSVPITVIRLLVPDLTELTVQPGDDVILPCQAADSSIRAVEWSRPDLEPDTVLYYSDGHLDPTYQHPSFKDRVELVDRDLKGGDVSLILKNVNINDNGTYECRVITDDTEPVRTVRLQVPEPAGSKKGNLLIYVVTAGVGLFFLTVVVGVLIYKICKNKRSEQPAAAADDEASADQLLNNSQSSLQLTVFSCTMCPT